VNHQRRPAFVLATVMTVAIVAGCGQGAARPVAYGTARSSRQAAVPVLGQRGIFDYNSRGFGEVRPATVFNGGDPTGLVMHITWSSWGGSTAIGAGDSDYVGPNQSVATGTQEKVRIVAFDLGTCRGKLMYRAVEWYFPQHSQNFNPSQYEDICTGNYVGE
jgi:hypothetical protein